MSFIPTRSPIWKRQLLENAANVFGGAAHDEPVGPGFRGSVYHISKPVSDADLALMRHIDECFSFMGARMLHDQLARKGIHVGSRHIGKLMRRMGIEALAPQPGTSKAAPCNKNYPYLLRRLCHR